MKIDIAWQKPISVLHDNKGELIFRVDLEKIPDGPGIYLFVRKFGSSFEALYVGKAENLRRRVKGQLNNLRLMRSIERAQNGKRILLVGELITGRGQRLKKVLGIAESAFIRHYLAEGHQLCNKSGTAIRRHSIASTRTAFRKHIPKTVHTEMKRI